MKKYTLILALVLILGLTSCADDKPSEGSANSRGNSNSLIQNPEENSATASNADPDDALPPDSIPVSQEKEILPEESPDPNENSNMQSQSDGMQRESDMQQGFVPDQETGRTKETGTYESEAAVCPSETSSEQPTPFAVAETAPEQKIEIPSQSSEPEVSAASEPETVPAEAPKSIYDYEFDVEAIRVELILLGESMGLTHITSDDGIACTPDTCSWASPITASQSLQGDNLMRALQSYVSSMPSIIISYGGSAISCFTIYVQDNGGGSYTFYFLY